MNKQRLLCLPTAAGCDIKWTGVVRWEWTDLSVDPNELLGVAFGPRRQLHVPQSCAVLHVAYREQHRQGETFT